ncbi:MAG: hypothetical protein RIS92_825 [Verrucomicrobiota bacterium]
MVCGFAGDDVVAGLVGVAVGEPAWEVAEQGVESVVLDDDGGIVSGAQVGAGEGLEFDWDSGEGVSAVVEHVLPFFEFFGVGGEDVEEFEIFGSCDVADDFVDFGGGFGIEVGDDGHGDDCGLGVVFAKFGDESVEIGGEVRGKVLAA